MSTASKHFITPEEYLEQERKSEWRNEYLDGEVFPISGASRNHALITTNLVRHLSQELDERPCTVYSSNLRVRVPRTGLYTYPDVVVTCGEEQFLDEFNDTLLNPVLIIEVLSDSTKDYDRGEKFAGYRTITSLQEYLTIAQDKIHIEQWQCQKDRRWLLSEHFDTTVSITLNSVDVELLVSEIYNRVKKRALI
ncbi:MAG: Uma2 family endonuclease [Acidobacteriaceae bacterium]|nr:Uma2 family endonuclease [Acidobacteriaceae bacterium]